jgi:glycosyltransferase involved in cell wall biosynthesis
MNLFVYGTRGIPGIQGGVERHCECLYPLFPPEYKITIFRRAPYIGSQGEKSWKNIRFIDLPSTRIKGLEAFFHSFLCTVVCLFRRPDMVHIHNIGPGIFIPFLKMGGIKTVLTYHSPNYEHAKWNCIAKKILQAGEYLSLKYASHIVFVSRKQREKFGRRIIAKSTWIPNGVLQPTASTATDYIESLGLTPQRYILAVGRITQEKKFDDLIRACRNLHYPGGKLVIAGGIDHATTYTEQIVRMAKENDVILAGFVSGENLRQLYSHAQIFALPSSHEGLPISLLEAMSYRLPAVVSDIPANLEMSIPEESYFKAGDIAALSDKLQDCICRNVQRVCYAMEQYDWNAIAAQTTAVYKKAAQ